jgi:hypothetical protein
MSHVDQSSVSSFAADRINLPKATADGYRNQVSSLRDRLAKKILADPDYGVVKMLHSGSVAKGTGLSTVSDLDTAVYVKAAEAPTSSDHLLIPWLAARLLEANPTMDATQFVEKDHCVTVVYKGSGLDVDVVPVLYEGEPDDIGYLVRKYTGERIKTSIPLHLKFIRDRKSTHGPAFAELIRITKWWKHQVCRSDEDFRFKSFMIELLWARLADSGFPLGNYRDALVEYFRYIVQTEFSERVAFIDFTPKHPARSSSAIHVIDPVNVDNNVADRYSASDRDRIVAASHEALSALIAAPHSPTKGQEVQYWQTILGPTFRGA